jgi:hypothetical protein
MSIILPGCALVFFSLLAFWRRNPVLFMIAAGVAILLGFSWWDTYPTDTGLGISLMLIVFSFTLVGFAFRYVFWAKPKYDKNVGVEDG